jgi:hypothetical protein
MNEVLPPRWDETIHRLGLGVEPQDAARRSRIPFPLELRRDGEPVPVPRRRRSPGTPWWKEEVAPGPFRRSRSCRFSLLLEDAAPDPLPLRLTDPGQRYVPRRLEIEEPAGRVIRPALYPGAAYDIPAGAVGMRGRVIRGDRTLPWVRVEALRMSDGAVVGRAHGDAEGEFVLLLGPGAAPGAELSLPMQLLVVVFGPDIPPDPDAEPSTDPLDLLPLETVPADGDEVLLGHTLPDGYVSRPGSTFPVDFDLTGLQRLEFDFS